MSTSVKTGRAWVPALVTTLLVAVLLFGCGLLREFLDDQDIARLRDPEGALGAYLYYPMAPLSAPGIIGDASFGDSMAQLGGGLVLVVILVFLFTWISARAARAGSSFTVLLGAWLGTALGVGLGSVASFQVFVWQNDIDTGFLAAHSLRVDRLGAGLYWGAVAGLLAGVVALLSWVIARPRADEPSPHVTPDAGPPELDPPDPSTFPPPGQHMRPATAPDATIPAPDPDADPAPDQPR